MNALEEARQKLPHIEMRSRECGFDYDEVDFDETIPDLQRIDGSDFGFPIDNTAPKPRPNLDADFGHADYGYDTLEDTRIAFIGAGAGAICLGSYLSLRGADPANMTFIDPNGMGGIWRQDWVRFGGFNNPAPLRFSRYHQLSLDYREGEEMEDFIRSIQNDHLLGAQLVKDKATGLSQNSGGEWHVSTNAGLTEKVDTVVIGTGQPTPRKINGERLKSNLDDFSGRRFGDEFVVERRQRELTEHELAQKDPIVLVGLGNSTAAMLHQIHTYEDETGTSVNYFVVTDKSQAAVKNPTMSFDGQKPVFRNPAQAYLTGYSGDLERDRSSYFRAINDNRVITGAESLIYDEEAKALKIGANEGAVQFNIGNPRVFALIGFNRNTRLLDTAETEMSRSRQGMGRFVVRACDGAVITDLHGALSNIYAIGSFAAGRNNPNAAVIPGIFGQIPQTSLTMGIRSQLLE